MHEHYAAISIAVMIGCLAVIGFVLYFVLPFIWG